MSTDGQIVGIVMISFNQAHFLRHAIASILHPSQDLSRVRLCVVDPGSTDGSIEIAKAMLRPCDIFINEPDNGPGDGLNKGLRAITGITNIFGYVNSDDGVLVGGISHIRAAFSQDKNTDIVACGISIINEGGG